MFTRADHVAISVKDMEKAIALGAQTCRLRGCQAGESGAWKCRLTGRFFA